MKFLNFSLLLILTSCSNGIVRKNATDATYRTSGIEQFFLPELPAWANHSSSGQCFKKNSFQYLDFNKIGSIYNLKYPQLLELQAQYNERLESYFRTTAARFLKPVEEAAFFSNTLENVRAGVRHFKVPEGVKEIDIIWLDRFIVNNQVQELKKMNDSGRFDENPPVIFTACFSKQDLSLWLIENNLDQVGIYSLTAEWLSPYGFDLQLKPGLQLDLKNLMKSDLKMNLITPAKDILPSEIIL